MKKHDQIMMYCIHHGCSYRCVVDVWLAAVMPISYVDFLLQEEKCKVFFSLFFLTAHSYI